MHFHALWLLVIVLRKIVNFTGDNVAPRKMYRQWESDLRRCEKQLFEDSPYNRGSFLLATIVKYLPKLLLRNSIAQAYKLERSLKLPDSPNLVSRRLHRLEIAGGKASKWKRADVRNMLSTENPFNGFFSETEVKRICATFPQSLPSVPEHTVRAECIKVIDERAFEIQAA